MPPASSKPNVPAQSPFPQHQFPSAPTHQAYALPSSRKRGKSYESKFFTYLADILGYRFDREVPLNGGYADGLVYGDVLALVECKATYTPDAWKQLYRYASDPKLSRGTNPPPALVVVCRTHRNDLPVPEGCRFLRASDFSTIRPGDHVIIPWSGKR
jgi:hypothetical protein